MDKKTPKRVKSLIIRLSTDELKRLKLEAIDRNITMSNLVRQAIKIYIEKFSGG